MIRKAFHRHENVTGAKINRGKYSGNEIDLRGLLVGRTGPSVVRGHTPAGEKMVRITVKGRRGGRDLAPKAGVFEGYG